MTADQAGRMRAMARWHRRIALFVMAWLGVLAVTGILVNHANDWGLDRKPLAPVLQRLVYGVEDAGADYCSTAPATGADCGLIFGRIDLPAGSLLLGKHDLFLLDAAGGLVEKLPVAQAGLGGLEAGVAAGGVIYLRDARSVVATGPDLLEFLPLGAEEQDRLPAVSWQSDRDSADISWERLFLDLHAARFLGPWAKAFNDVVGGLLLLLALSGFWLHRIRKRVNGNRRL